MSVGADNGARMVYDYNAGGNACSQPIDFTKESRATKIQAHWGNEKIIRPVPFREGLMSRQKTNNPDARIEGYRIVP